MREFLGKYGSVSSLVRYSWAWLALLSAFITLYAIVTFDGFYFYDDFNYMGYAAQVARGEFQLVNEIFTHRFGVFVPVGLLYLLLGINEWTSLAWPFLCTLATPLVVFLTLKKTDVQAAILAAMLTGLEFYIIFFANKLMPDSIVSFFSLACLYSVFQMRSLRSRDWKYAVAGAAFLLVALLTKLTAIFIAPMLLLVCSIDLVHRRQLKVWGIFTAIFLLGIAALLTYYWLSTGDPLFRLHSIQDNHYINEVSYYDKPFIFTLHRITWQPVGLFLGSGMGAVFILALPGLWKAITQVIGQNRINSDPLTFYGLAALGMLLTFWFCTTSLRYYNPIGLTPRMVFSIVPVMAILGGIRLSKAVSSGIWPKLWPMLFLVGAIWILRGSNWQVGVLLAGWALLSALGVFFGKMPWFKLMVLPTILLLLLTHPVHSLLKSKKQDYFEEKEVIAQYLNDTSVPTLVLTDARLVRAHAYYYDFRVPGNVHFADFAEADTVLIQHSGKVFILRNSTTLKYLHALHYDVLPNARVEAIPSRSVYQGKELRLDEVVR